MENKETLADKRIILPRMGRLENYENQDIIMCYGKDVKKFIQEFIDEVLKLHLLAMQRKRIKDLVKQKFGGLLK